jgi:hypothetical protein
MSQQASPYMALWEDVLSSPVLPPGLVAHYTGIDALEGILKNGELWFSNPLYTNDTEELIAAMQLGLNAFHSHAGIKTACSADDYKTLTSEFDRLWRAFDEGAIDVYVFCTSEHDAESDDGLLSMWRGYGHHGAGVAVVFDPRQIPLVPGSPVLVGKVDYRTPGERNSWIDAMLDRTAAVLRTQGRAGSMHDAARAVFERLKHFALFTKHRGFMEEREWRAVYLRERDVQNKLVHLIDYHKTPEGPHPKFKYRPTSLGDGLEPVALEKLVVKIIAGPMLAEPRAFHGLRRMIEITSPALAHRLVTSSTPYRRAPDRRL